MGREFKSVDEYIAAQPEAVRAALSRVRSAIRKAVPRAEETISYKIPAYRLDGERLIYFAAWKKYYSLYPATKRLIDSFKVELAAHEVVKSTVRISYGVPVPVGLIAKLTKFRTKEVAGRKAASSR